MNKEEKPQKGIKAIVFDMGGVVLLGKSEDIYSKLSKKLGVNPNLFQLVLNKHKKAMLKGELSPLDFCELLKKRFNINADIVQAWKESYLAAMPINKKLISLIKRLKKTYRVAVITNTNELHAAINRDRGLFEYFDPTIISNEVNLVKPQREIFVMALKKMGLDAESCILLEDREEQLKIPKELGFKTILFKNNKQLVHDLKKLGVKI
jgi:glucose-1-phosphatase